MKKKTILILGGYGGVGQVMSDLILKELNVNLIIAGHNLKKAEEFTKKLSKKYPKSKISSRFADLNNLESLKKAFKNIDMVLLTCATTPMLKEVAQVALDAKIDWFDIFFRAEAYYSLKTLAPRIKKSKQLFITQGGFHPGLPSVFVRQAASHLDQIEKAVVAMTMNAKFKNFESAYELVDEIADYKAEIFVDKKWRIASYKDARKIDFGKRFGTKSCMPIQMEEIKLLPKFLKLKEVMVLVSGFNFFVDNFIVPSIMLANKIKKGIFKKQFAKMTAWGVNKFSPKQKGVIFLVDAEGKIKNKKVKIRIVADDKDAYHFTAAPVVACLKQYLDKYLNESGLHMMGNLVNPERLLKDLETMKVKIETSIVNLPT